MPTAPAGFLTLGDAALRFAERLRCNRKKAEYRVARETSPGGRLRLVAMATLELRATAEGDRLDFAASEVVPATGGFLFVNTAPDGSMQGSSGGGIPVVLDADDVARVLDELAPPATGAAPAPAAISYPPPAQPAASAPRTPGRPSTYDWPFYAAQARRRVYRHGLPEKSSILVAEVLALFGREERDNQPDERTVEREVAKWWPGLVKLAADIEELDGPCEITPISNSRRIK